MKAAKCWYAEVYPKNFVCSDHSGGLGMDTGIPRLTWREECAFRKRKDSHVCCVRLRSVEDEADIVRDLNMGDHTVPLLLITANVGSVFENVSKYACNELRASHTSNTALPCQ